jgi:SpoVK/Ycf46/Vps4 family AAA+-type ATPase
LCGVEEHFILILLCAPKPGHAVGQPSNERFADLDGMDDAKEQIRQMVEAHLRPERSKRYGLSRNGILLYGPRSTGETLLAKATAGEFGLNLV